MRLIRSLAALFPALLILSGIPGGQAEAPALSDWPRPCGGRTTRPVPGRRPSIAAPLHGTAA